MFELSLRGRSGPAEHSRQRDIMLNAWPRGSLLWDPWGEGGRWDSWGGGWGGPDPFPCYPPSGTAVQAWVRTPLEMWGCACGRCLSAGDACFPPRAEHRRPTRAPSSACLGLGPGCLAAGWLQWTPGSASIGPVSGPACSKQGLGPVLCPAGVRSLPH